MMMLRLSINHKHFIIRFEEARIGRVVNLDEIAERKRLCRQTFNDVVLRYKIVLALFDDITKFSDIETTPSRSAGLPKCIVRSFRIQSVVGGRISQIGRPSCAGAAQGTCCANWVTRSRDQSCSEARLPSSPQAIIVHESTTNCICVAGFRH